MDCPECGSKMWMTGTFGPNWHCLCGNTEDVTKEQREAYNEWKEEYQRELDARNYADISRGLAIQTFRIKKRMSLKNLADELGCSCSQLSSWEHGVGHMSSEDFKKAMILISNFIA